MLDLAQIEEKVRSGIITEPCFLVEAEISGSGGSRIVRFIVDTDEGIKLDKLVELNRTIGDMLENEELIPFKYRLEVVSPGLHRSILHPRLQQKAIGSKLKAVYTVAGEGDKRLKIKGRLDRINQEGFHFDVDGRELVIQAECLVDMHYILEW
jgi:ribosome maturation factor RimP